jgi:hypothetical protein
MTFAENVVACFERATADERWNGMTWYPRAREFAFDLDSDVWRAAGVIAALSAQKEWRLNMRLASRAYLTGTVTGNTGVQNAKAQRILDGNYSPGEILDILNGDKTRQFCSAIATGGNSDIAVIDRHAHDIAMGRVFDNNKRVIGKSLYRRMAMHYSEAAKECGISVAQMQAITWVTWKREKGHK